MYVISGWINENILFVLNPDWNIMTFISRLCRNPRHHDYFHFIAILSCWFLTASLVVALFLSTTDFINFTSTIYLLFRTNQTFPFQNLEIFSQLLPTGQNFFSPMLFSATIQIRTSMFSLIWSQNIFPLLSAKSSSICFFLFGCHIDTARW